MCSHPKKMNVSARVAFFVLCMFNIKSFARVIKDTYSCTDRLTFTTLYQNNEATHMFRLRYTGGLFTAKNNCSAETVKRVSSVNGMNISTELGFFARQWYGLRLTASSSPLGSKRLNLTYHFDPFTKDYEFYFFSGGTVLVYCSSRSQPVINKLYQSDGFVQKCKYGIALDNLRNNSIELAAKWSLYCERSKAKSHTSSPPPYPPIQTTTEMDIIFVTPSTDPLNPSNTIEGAEALSAGETASIVIVFLLAAVLTPAAYVAWKQRDSLRTKFQKVTTL